MARPGRAVLALLALLGGALGLLLDRPAMRNPDAYFYAGPLYVWGHLAFFAASGAAAGTLAGATHPGAVGQARVGAILGRRGLTRYGWTTDQFAR